jgi:hypothetical protein
MRLCENRPYQTLPDPLIATQPTGEDGHHATSFSFLRGTRPRGRLPPAPEIKLSVFNRLLTAHAPALLSAPAS